jgi:hypothetical protein
LTGKVSGHPRLPDGDTWTSTLKRLYRKRGIAFTLHTRYTLIGPELEAQWQVVFVLYGAEFASSQHYSFKEARRICREVDKLVCFAKAGQGDFLGPACRLVPGYQATRD